MIFDLKAVVFSQFILCIMCFSDKIIIGKSTTINSVENIRKENCRVREAFYVGKRRAEKC